MDEDIQQWLRFAESDMKSAEALHRVGEHLNAIFHLQQAVEKALKAILIKKSSSFPPRTHDLNRLAQMSGLQLDPRQRTLLHDLKKSYIDSRYPEAWGGKPPVLSTEKTGLYLAETREFLAWLRQLL